MFALACMQNNFKLFMACLFLPALVAAYADLHAYLDTRVCRSAFGQGWNVRQSDAHCEWWENSNKIIFFEDDIITNNCLIDKFFSNISVFDFFYYFCFNI